MSVEDLAIDVGIPVNTEEFDTFVSCVENILDHGCGYSADVTVQICERCETSELPVAKRVLRECRRAASNTSRMRPSKLKWWQTWRSKREGRDVPRWPGRAASPSPKRRPHKARRPMELTFNNKRNRPTSPPPPARRRRAPKAPRKRPMSPMFKKRNRPASPRFDREDAIVYDRSRTAHRDTGRGYARRDTTRPEAPSKRRRYR